MEEIQIADASVLPEAVEPLTLEALAARVKELEAENEASEAELEEDPAEESLAAFCMETAFVPDATVLTRVQSVALMVLLTIVQSILGYGFEDSIYLLVIRGSANIYSDPRHAEYYAGKMVDNGECEVLSDDACNGQPRINVAASIVAVTILAAGPVLADDYTTLYMSQPVEHLLIDTRPRPGGLLRRASDILTLIIMQTCWGVRAFLVPMWGISGTAMAMANSESAFDIVLNAIAIGFIFELDDVLYVVWKPTGALRRRLRRRYESKATAPRASPLIVPDSALMARRWALPLLVLSIVMGCQGYVDVAFSTDPDSMMKPIRSMKYILGVGRLALFIMASIHLNIRALAHLREAEPKRTRGGDAMRVAVCALVLCVSAGVTLVIDMQIDHAFGFVFSPT